MTARAASLDLRIEKAVGNLYDAAAEPERWPKALTGISELLGAVGAQFLLMDNGTGAVPFSVHAGFDPEVNRLYCGHYGAIDPKQPYFLNSPPGKPFLCHEHFSEDFVRRSEFFQDFLIPSGSRWCMGTKLVQTPDVSAMVGIHRSERMAAFADDSVALFEGLVPHLRRAAGLHLRFERMRAMEASVRSALDRLAFGVILVDAGLRARASNAAAEEILKAGDGLGLRRGRLAAARPTETRALEALLAGAVRTGRDGGLHPGGAMALPRPPGKRPLSLTVAPLRRRPMILSGDADGFRPAAVLFVADPERLPENPAARLRGLYRLTERESQLVGILIAGRGLESAAEEMGITRESARGYLKRIFEKTGTRRLAELVALLMRGLTPVL